MTRPTIGWYVHHHGHGHLTRFLAVRPHLDADVVCFSTLEQPASLPEGTAWIRLDRDDQDEQDRDGAVRHPGDGDPSASGLLHWAPLAHGGHRSRLGRIAVETLRRHLTSFVVDVSVEVTLLVRVLGVPVILIAQPGRRTDEPHRLAFRAASRIIAPWPDGFIREPRFDSTVDVVHTGGISRFDGRPVPPVEERAGILVLLGSGGGEVTAAQLSELDVALPADDVTVLGPGHDWVADPWRAIGSAAVVVAWAGQNSVADLAVASARAVVIPQARPFDEQVEMGAALERHGLTVVEKVWPDAWDWPVVIDRATRLEPEWSSWQTSGAAARAAAAILETTRRWFV